MTDVFEVLGGDHAAVKRMLDALESSPDNSSGATEAVVAARKAVAERLIIGSSAHETAEEQYFWPTVRQLMPSGNDLADEAIEQESEAKNMLYELGKLGGGRHEFDALVDTLIPACRAHIEFEESRVWPGLRKVLSQGESQELGKKIAQAKQHGPTRPHPLTPPTPAVLATLGPAVAVVDKLRDAVAGRG
ncbi:MAG TPA: hemerythrin domain-containing protein [Streptosporangiaceae bacterium]|nr:hemerythrin domain-containing protein [Streptosporangiaceae bacterium]